MAGQLDSLLKKVAKQVVSDLGSSLDTTISYTKKGISQYNIETGEEISVDTTFSDIKAPVEESTSTSEAVQEQGLQKSMNWTETMIISVLFMTSMTPC